MLQGQSEASTNATGFAYVDSLALIAILDVYPLVLSMPDYPEVLFTIPPALCMLVNVAHAHTHMHMHMLSTLEH